MYFILENKKKRQKKRIINPLFTVGIFKSYYTFIPQLTPVLHNTVFIVLSEAKDYIFLRIVMFFTRWPWDSFSVTPRDFRPIEKLADLHFIVIMHYALIMRYAAVNLTKKKMITYISTDQLDLIYFFPLD